MSRRGSLNAPDYVPLRTFFKVSNTCLLLLILGIKSTSLLNGLQAFSIWMSFMEHPGGTWLRFINTLYWIGAAISATVAA